MITCFKGRWRTACLAIVCAGLASGCAVGNRVVQDAKSALNLEPDRAPATPAEERMRARADQFEITVFQGVAAGAAVGCGAGLLIGGGFSDCLIGGGAGAIIGAAAGTYVANQNEKAGDARTATENMISDLRRKNQEARELISEMELVVAEDRRLTAAAKADLAAQRISQQDYDRQIARQRDNARRIRKAADNAQAQAKTFRAAEREHAEQNPGVSTARMTSEVDALDNHGARMLALADEAGAADQARRASEQRSMT